MENRAMTTNTNESPLRSVRTFLSKDQIAFLNTDVPQEFVLQRQVGGQSGAKYLQKEYLAATLNELFGFDGWSRETFDIVHLSSSKINMSDPVDRNLTVPGYACTYSCRVRLTIAAESEDGRTRTFHRDGTGTTTYMWRESEKNWHHGEVAEIAVKGAETDGFKRACATLGRRLGMDIDEQESAQVRLSPSQQLMAGGAPAASQGQVQASSNGRGNGNPPRAETRSPVQTRLAQTAAPQTAAAQSQDIADWRPPATLSLGEDATGTDPWEEVRTAATETIDYARYDRTQWTVLFKTITADYKTSPASTHAAIARLRDCLPAIVANDDRTVFSYHTTMTARIAAFLQQSRWLEAAQLQRDLATVTERYPARQAA
jgi:hypothetical protein